MARLTQRLGFTRYEADEYYKQALEAYHKRRFDDAIDAMNNAIEVLPTRSEYFATRGFFFLEDGVKDKALADFEKALKLYRYEMLAHYGRGVIAYNDRNWDEALAHFTDAYRADPKRPETLYYLAIIYHRKGNNDGARQLMEQALAGFEAANDRRKGDAQKWVREFTKQIDTKAKPKLPAFTDKGEEL
jgi:tetratricopeptide (TPR) repeat protein